MTAVCGDLTVEEQQTFDPSAVQVVGCAGASVTIRPGESVTLDAEVANPNAANASADVGFFATDLPDGPGLGVQPTQTIFSGGSTVSLTVDPSAVPSSVSDIATRIPFTSRIEAFVLPGSVVNLATGDAPVDPQPAAPAVMESPATALATDGGRPASASGCRGCKARSQKLSRMNRRLRDKFDFL